MGCKQRPRAVKRFKKMTMNDKELPKDSHPKWFHEKKIQYLVSATPRSYQCWLSTVPKLEAFSHTSPLLPSMFYPWRVQNQKERGKETVAQRRGKSDPDFFPMQVLQLRDWILSQMKREVFSAWSMKVWRGPRLDILLLESDQVIYSLRSDD